jgi:hypothetical protein
MPLVENLSVANSIKNARHRPVTKEQRNYSSARPLITAYISFNLKREDHAYIYLCKVWISLCKFALCWSTSR